MSKSSVKVVLTGGHAATTALSVVEEIVRKHHVRWKIYWIGARSAFEGKRVATLESNTFPKKGVIYHQIIAGRVQKKFTAWTLPSIFKIPIGILHSFVLLARIRPDVILSFGGYVSFPVVLVSWLMRIPIVVHDQTAAAGRASRITALFASAVAISRKESARYFPKHKTVLTGNPIMSQIWDVPVKLDPDDPPVLFITGGSRGSRTINNMVLAVLPDLISKFYVVHQTGELDWPRFKKIRNERYEAHPTIDPMQMDRIYARCDIVVARAGANTVSEIIAIKRPSVLIPISWSAYDEQSKNALLAKKFGAVLILDENKADPSELVDALSALLKNYSQLVSQIVNRSSPDWQAERKLVNLLERFIK